MIGYRRAAVALHDLREEDRQWLLAELPDEDRGVLQGLLKELSDLGFEPARNAANIPTMQATIAGNVHACAKAGDIVRRANASDMVTLLEHEPSSLIAQILAVGEWPWKQSYLQALPALRRDRIASISLVPAQGAARNAFLLDWLAKRLHSCRDMADATPFASCTLPFKLQRLQVVRTILQKAKRWIL